MRWASPLVAMIVMMMVAGGAGAAADCPTGDDVRGTAECIHDQMPPDVIEKLYRLALSTVNGKLDPEDVPADFRYIAEEAGEAARRKTPKPLVAMASSNDVGKLAFAARAITAYVDAVRYGHSHRQRFDGEDTKQFAGAKKILSAPCKRLAAQDNRFVRAEGERCLSAFKTLPRFPVDGPEAELGGLRAVDLKVGAPGGLRASSGATPAPPTAKPSRKPGPQSPGTDAR
jgi:hypothetical protein